MAKGLKTIRQTAKNISDDTGRIERHARLLEKQLSGSKATVLKWKNSCVEMEQKLQEREDALKEKDATILAYANGEVLTAAQAKIEELDGRLQNALRVHDEEKIPKIRRGYETQIRELNAEIERLKNAQKYLVLRGRSEVRVQLLAKQKEMEQLEKEHQKQIDDLFVEFKKEIEQLDGEYGKIVEELADEANKRIEAIQEEAKGIEKLFADEIGLKDEELKRAMARVKELSDERKELDKYVLELETSIFNLEEDNKELTGKLSEAKTALSVAKAKSKKTKITFIGVAAALLLVATTAGAVHPYIANMNVNEPTDGSGYVEYLDKYEEAKQENASLVDQLAQKDAKIAELSEKLETTLNNLDAAKLDFEQRLADLDLSTVDKVALGEIFGEDFSGLSDAEVLAKLESERMAYEAAIVKLKNDLDLKNSEIENLNGTIERLEYLVDSLEKENKLLKSLTNKASDSLVGGGNTVSSAGVSEKFEVVRNDGAIETREVIGGQTCVTRVESRDAFTGAKTVVDFEYDENGNLISQTVTQIAGNGDIISQIVNVGTGEGGNSVEPGNQGGTGDATEDDSAEVGWK